MTKVIILGEAQGAEPEKKKIEFVRYLDSNGTSDPSMEPFEYQHIELICKKYIDNNYCYDLMFAHNGDRSRGCLYLGKFNDGIV